MDTLQLIFLILASMGMGASLVGKSRGLFIICSLVPIYSIVKSLGLDL